jgi:hypothetical protein
MRRSTHVPGQSVVEYVLPAQSPQKVISMSAVQCKVIVVLLHALTKDDAMAMEVLSEITTLRRELGDRHPPS